MLWVFDYISNGFNQLAEVLLVPVLAPAVDQKANALEAFDLLLVLL